MLILVDRTSIFSYFYSLSILFLLNIIVNNKTPRFTFLCYHYYLLFAVGVYFLNKYQLPTFIGTTGPMGIGTDDYTFYGQIVDGYVPYELEVPAEYKYPFSIFLKLLYPFTISTPLNVALFNTIFVSYLPYYTGQLAEYLFNDKRVAKYSKIFILLCPMTTLYGVIIIRDLLVTTLVIAAIFYFLQKKIIHVIACVSLVFFIRFGSVSFIASSFLVILISRTTKSASGRIKALIIGVITIISFIIIFPILQEYSGGKLSDNIVRDVGGEYYEGSTIAAIVSLPFPINIILSSIFFAYAPFLSVPSLYNGIFVIISFFNATLTPLYFLILSPYFYNALISRNKSRNHKLLISLFIIFLVVLGTVSLQIRHKNIIFPLISILSAYGYAHFNRRYQSLTALLTLFTILFEMAYALYCFL